MDAHVLLECFAGTLQANQAIRQQAELGLKELAKTPGFLGGCLDIIGSENESQVSPAVRKAAAVYFKNRVVKYWMISEPTSSSNSTYRIDNDERPVVKDRILKVLIRSDYHVKQQLIPVLRILISYEWPQRWPELLQETGTLLQQPLDTNSSSTSLSNQQLYVGLLCFSEICRKFRWVGNEDREKELDPIISQVFPHLLNVGNAIISLDSNNLSENLFEMLKLILKSFKFVSYFDLPEILQSRDVLMSWSLFHGAIINMSPPLYIIEGGLNESEKSLLQASKCYKWAFANLYRLFTRYASVGLSKKYNYIEFHQMFIGEIIPSLINNFLQLIEKWCAGERWLSLASLYHLLQFLSHCVTQKSTWQLIKPYFETLVQHLVYPLLCPNDDMLEIFETDPHEYIHAQFDVYDEVDTPDIAALGLLVTLVDKRRKTTLSPIITFAYNKLNEVVNAPEETLAVAKQKEGALRLIGCISHYVVVNTSPYYSQMEPFVANLVVPNLQSNYEFVKARALEVTSRFADLEFQDSTVIAAVFHAVTANFDLTNSSLPVNFICSLVIQAYLPNEQFKEAIQTNILPTMSKLLELSEEIDNDAVSVVMQECVENFSEQLQPFGEDLMSKLVEQFMRLAVEIRDATASVDIDDFDANDNDDSSEKTMAAIGLLNTMITVLLSFENSQQILNKLEQVFYPVIEFVLVNKIDDFFAEVGELVENSTFLVRGVSPTMWNVFRLISNTFNGDQDGNSLGLLYIEELMPSIQNFLTYGSAELQVQPDLVSNFYHIFQSIVDGDESQVGLNDIAYACELAQSLILALQQNATQFVPGILKRTLDIYVSMMSDKQHVRNNAIDVNVQNVVVAALVYDLPNAVTALEARQLVGGFFDRWLKLIPLLQRVYDLKLSLLGLISILSSRGEILAKLNDTVPVGKLVGSMLLILRNLPEAMNNLEKKRTEFGSLDHSAWELENQFNSFRNEDDDDDYEDIEDGGSTTVTESATAGETEAGDYDSFLKQQELKSTGFYDEEDEEIVEDPLCATPLDNLNVFKLFKDFVVNMESEDVNKYQGLFGELDDAETQVIKDVFEVVQD
ncbi:nonsense-mediated mRNA decay protein 5 [[Candida] anglica]|uniref:Nonsense-mediated mRNA decay protein 5 n=1 Tax=[Candida] anglica TaxID=148631 RepID=A0ABP0EAM6_9ASCO